MNKIFSKKLWTVVTVAVASLLVIAISLYTIAYSYQTLLNSELKLVNYRLVTDGEDTGDTEYFKAKYDTKETIHDYSFEVSEKLEAEGLVLLENKNNALPLGKTADIKVSLFGTGSVNVNCSVQGMRGANDKTDMPTLKEAFEAIDDGNGKVEVNPVLWDFYDSGAGSRYGGEKRLDASTNIQTYYINEAPWSVYDVSVRGSFAGYGDAAIAVLTRDDTEGADMNALGSDGKDGNYLALSPEEEQLLKELTALKHSNVFKKLVVLLNGAGAMQLDFMTNDAIDVDALMWIGNTGMSGVHAVAKAIVGDVNPSGRLSDTYVYDNFSSPAMASQVLNDGRLFSGAYDDASLNNTQRYYGVYVEGVYVGYRYYETRYADAVEGAENVGDYDYSETVAYTFGSGKSYTAFDYSGFGVKESVDGKSYEASVTVKNTGSVAGKEVVQVYLQKPYTDYSKENLIEVPAVELAGFAKTKMLAPGETDTVKITVEKEDFAVYDVYGAETYVIDEGEHFIAAGKNAHDALNNILAAKGFDVASGMDYDGNSSLVWSDEFDFDETTYSVSGESGEKVENRLAFADVNRNVGAGGNIVTYVSRGDWEATFPKTAAELELTDAMKLGLESDIEPESEGESITYGASNGLTLVMMRGKDYDDDDWDRLLDEMTYDDVNTLLSTAYCVTAAIPGIVKPRTDEQDGPTYCKQGVTGSRFPCEGIWAATFNTELLAEVGTALANDSLFCGYNGMWIPGINIHRTPYGGRSHEYFSEDPYLTGMMAQAQIIAMQEYGVIAYPKHFIFNDQEDKRNGIGTWLNEQSAREIYLRPWKYACSPSRGNAHGVMSSFNRAGTVWTSASDGLVNGILRGEFGFNGIIITDMADANGTVYMSCVDGIVAGTDIWLSSGKDHTFMPYKNNLTVTNAMREACHRVLYNVCNYSAAMNGLSENTRIVRVYVWWEVLVITLLAVSVVLTAGAGAMLVLCMIKEKRK